MTEQRRHVLILWDIDHTLVSIQGVSRDIYALAFEAATGRPMQELADMAGRTEKAIITETLRLNGIEPDWAFDAFYDTLRSAAKTLEGRMRESGHALPRAGAAIMALAEVEVVQSVVTGNIRSIAEIKLEAFGLDADIDFSVGGYGDDDQDRAVLVKLAMERTEARYGNAVDPGRVVVIGDTPHDVKGALDCGAIAVGVATGGSSVEELIRAGADVVFADLSDTASLKAAITERLAVVG